MDLHRIPTPPPPAAAATTATAPSRGVGRPAAPDAAGGAAAGGRRPGGWGRVRMGGGARAAPEDVLFQNGKVYCCVKLHSK